MKSEQEARKMREIIKSGINNKANIMTRQEIEQIVIEGIGNRLCIPYDQISPKDNFITDLYCDSIDEVELIIDVELKFDISISDVQALKFHTVKDVIDYLNETLNNI